jgi:outer membrane protein
MIRPIISFILCGLVLTAYAAERLPISLEEAKSRALENNPTLTQAELDVKAARWGMLSAVADALPQVTFNSSVIRSDESTVDRQNIMRDVILQEYGQYIDPEEFPPFAYRDMYASNISIEQPIYNGGVELTALRIAGTRKKLIKLAREMREKELLLEVETAYYNFCRAYRRLEVQEHALEVTQGYLERVGRQAELGMQSALDVLRWEVEVSNSETALIDARNSLKLAELSLEQVMGEAGKETYYPSDLPVFDSDAGPDLMRGISPLDTIWQEMQASSPDLEISRHNVKLEGHNVWLASSHFQPKLNATYTYSWQADDDLALDGFESWTAGITLSMPLFSSFGNLAKYQEARVNLKRARVGARDYENVLYIQLTAAYNDLQAALSRLTSAQKVAKQAGKVLSSQENRHELGVITTLELLDARTVELTADLGLINARFDALIARSQLTRLAGDAAFIEAENTEDQ